jgi:two-component system response regulator
MQGNREILLVEDEDADAELASRAFRHAETANSLVRVRDGIEALDYLYARDKYASRDVHELPMFILLDLNIPKLSGLEVLAEIRADARTKHLPVIILTSSAEEKDRLTAYDRFANSYIVKPLNYDKFVAATLQLSLYWSKLNTPPPPLVEA